MKKVLCLLLAVLILCPVTGLTEETDAEIRMTEDAEKGFWEYVSPDLTIQVNRYRETKKIKGKKKTVEYCVADIHASENAPMFPVMTDPSKKRVAGYKLVSPELLVEKANPIFAVSDDMYGLRIQKYKFQGVVIRNGEVMSTKTRNSKKSRAWPNLDTMAFYGDGTAKTFVCDALTADEYLEQGATQVLSFGPWLISEGTINPEVMDPKYYPYNEPRVAIGVIEPYHYIVVVVKGRPTNQYAGVHLDWLAQKMQELGCTEALNLDGGATATMFFNGKVILQGDSSLRSQGSLLCFGAEE